MAVYTLKPDHNQEQQVEALKKHYGEKAATKALLMAAVDVPAQAKEIEQLKNELSDYRDFFENMKKFKMVCDNIASKYGFND